MSSNQWRTNLNQKQSDVADVLRLSRQWWTRYEFEQQHPGVGGVAPDVRMRELRRAGLVESRSRPDSGGQIEFRWARRVRPIKKRRVRRPRA